MATGRNGPRLWQLRSTPASENGRTVLILEGRLGHATAGELKAIVESVDTSKDVVLDLSGVDYLSSAGIKVIEDLAAEQAGRGGGLTVRSPSPAARLSLELSGLARLLAIALVLVSTVVIHAGQPSPAGRGPNVVLIITDDVGYGDIGSYGAPDISTPNIDRLAASGVRFTDFYANGSSCSPTRAGLISGRYQSRYAIDLPLPAAGPDIRRGLPSEGHSLPQLLRNSGYATALIGKWHLGFSPRFSPGAHGFGTFFGFKTGFIDYYHHTDSSGLPDLYENDRPVKVDGYLTDEITRRSVAFIAANARRPFFLEVAYNAAHWPYQVPGKPSRAVDNGRHVMPFDPATSTRADYASILERADQGVGQIIASLAKAGIAGNTLIIFTNDNGGEWLSRNAPLFNRKFSLWEGGIRVPAIIAWPGRVPPGRVTAQVGITMDLTATIVAATRSAIPAGVTFEGIDLMPIVEGASPVVDRTLFWRVVTPALNQRAMRSGKWKLIRDGGAGRTMLFDLSNDIGERNDLAAAQPDVTRRLHGQLADWEQDVDSEARTRAAAGSGIDPAVTFFVRANRMRDAVSGESIGPAAIQIVGDHVRAIVTGDAATRFPVDLDLGDATLLPGANNGRIAVGAIADLIAVAGEPSREGSRLSQAVFVMQKGKVVRRP
jgi:anti-anti-sigma factor